jgi:hypothetical protein
METIQSNNEIFLALETALMNKYQIFESGASYIEIDKDYINIDCQKYYFQYLGRYVDWIINFVRKFMTNLKYRGFVYVFGYILEFK